MAKTSAEHVEHPRSLKARAFPFVWHWMMALGVLPGVATALWTAGRRDPGLRALLAAGTVLATWALYAIVIALAEHAGRRPFIVKHTSGTVLGIGFAWVVTILWGWTPTWAAVYFFGALVGAASWNAHRVDALRSRPDDKKDDKGLAELLGFTHLRLGKPRVVDAGVAVTVTAEPGGTVKDAQDGLPKLEAAAAGAIPGRSHVVQDPGDAAKGELTLVTHDVLRTWQPWPGPSALGGSIADPIVTGYYEDGDTQRYWFCAGKTGEGEPRVGTHIGRMGMSGAGKTGDAQIELAEVLTRRDTVLLYADATKGAQTAAPLMSGITLFADTAPKAKVLFRGVRQLVRDRADRLGAHGFADWAPTCATHPVLRMPAVVVFVDEADELITDPAFTWLATKGRSTGVFLSVTLPRADHASMPPTARFSIGAWKCFGVGDDYSAEFALTEGTRKAGATAVENWRNTKPGYHYLDTAPGVDARRYPVPCRSFMHDDAQIEAAVRAGARYRMALPPEDVASLGQAWEYCQPADARQPVMDARMQAVAEAAAADPQLARFVKGLADKLSGQSDGMKDNDEEGSGMYDEDDEDDPVAQVLTDARRDAAADGDAGDDVDEEVDPSQPIPPHTGPDLPIDDGKPDASSPEEAVRAFDELLVAMAGEGKTEIQVADVAERYPYHLKPWVSKRLTALAEGAVVSPPGLTLERTPDGRAGRYVLIHLNGGAGGHAQ